MDRRLRDKLKGQGSRCNIKAFYRNYRFIFWNGKSFLRYGIHRTPIYGDKLRSFTYHKMLTSPQTVRYWTMPFILVSIITIRDTTNRVLSHTSHPGNGITPLELIPISAALNVYSQPRTMFTRQYTYSFILLSLWSVNDKNYSCICCKSMSEWVSEWVS